MCSKSIQRLLSPGSEGGAVFIGNKPRGHSGEDGAKKKKEVLIRDKSPASAAAPKQPPLG